MELGWTALAMILVAVAVVWFWQNSLAARERANAAAVEACERLSLQFLDGTVAFARIVMVRDDYGRLALQRTYVFDYTADSIARRQGFIVLTGLRLDSVGYAPGEGTRAPPPSPPPPPAAAPLPPLEHGSRSNVLNLEDWRAKHRRPPERNPERREDRGDGRQ